MRKDAKLQRASARSSRANDPGTTLVGLGFSRTVPVVTNSSPSSMYHAMANRMAADVALEYRPGVFDAFQRWVKKNFTRLFGAPCVVHRMEQAVWESRFPEAKRRRLRLAWSNLQKGDYGKRWQRTGCFVKREHLLKDAAELPLDYTPRPISPFTDTANAMLGPWMAAMHKVLKNRWSSANWMTYGSGYDGHLAGQWFQAALGPDWAVRHSESGRVFENDFSTFDLTQHTGCFELARWVFRMFGLGFDAHASAAYDTQFSTDCVAACGHRLTCKAVMKSGCANTTLQNTMLNLLMHAYVYSKITAQDVDQLSATYRIIGNGDDNVTICSEPVLIPSMALMADGLFRKLGLVPKLLCKTPATLRFNGSNLVPCIADGKPSLALCPMLGRLGPKLGYSLTPSNASRAWLNGVLTGVARLSRVVPFLDGLVKANYAAGAGEIPWIGIESKYKVAQDVVLEPDFTTAMLWVAARSGLAMRDLEEWNQFLCPLTAKTALIHHHVIDALLWEGG